MFDISIGTLIPIGSAATMIPKLNPKGFECYALDCNGTTPAQMDLPKVADSVRSALDKRNISCLGFYANPIMQEEDRAHIAALIRNASQFGCTTLGVFAGGDPAKSVPDTIEQFKAVWSPLAELAESCGVKIGFEACGSGWSGGCHNIGFCPDAWELMFEAVPSDALGLEWEPCHALYALADPIAQLRRWAHRVVHVHGKDATIAWDVIRDHGLNGAREYCWSRTPGFGDTNWADIFTILLQAGFTGACDIEGYHDVVHYDDMEWTAQIQSAIYLKACRGGQTFWFGPKEYRGYQGSRK